jgi:hypothetical protein
MSEGQYLCELLCLYCAWIDNESQWRTIGETQIWLQVDISILRLPPSPVSRFSAWTFTRISIDLGRENNGAMMNRLFLFPVVNHHHREAKMCSIPTTGKDRSRSDMYKITIENGRVKVLY